MILAKENIEILKRIAAICEKEPDEPHLFRHASDTELKGAVKEGEFVDGYHDHIGTVCVCYKNKLVGLMAGEDDEVTLLCYIEKLNKDTGEFERDIPFGMTVDEAIESELLGKGDIIRFVDVNGNKVESIEHMDCEDPLGLFFIGVDPVQHQMDMEDMEFDDDEEYDGCDHHHDENDDDDEIDTDLGPVSLTNVLSYILEYKDCIEAAASLEEVKDFLQ